jgi:hypothetical protein
MLETKADCNNCNMLQPKRSEGKCYSPNTKCCTFWPYLPNYLVGAILTENLPGKKQIQQYIMQNQQAVVLPIGITAPIKYQVQFNNRKKDDFGRRQDLLCPYYDKGSCKIWEFRGSVCATWFCQSSFGEEGKEFWKIFLDYLSAVEMSLAQDCLVMTGYSPRITRYNLEYINRKEATESEMNGLQDWTLELLWQDFFKEQESFYLWCYNYVKNLSRSEFETLIGKIGVDYEKLSIAKLERILLKNELRNQQGVYQ